MKSLARFSFIADAIDASGGFAPQAAAARLDDTAPVSATYLVQYPRESNEKFNRRNEIATYRNFLLSACSRFTGFLFGKSANRSTTSPLFEATIDDIDMRGNAANVFWQEFALQAKARGTMLLLVDMPESIPDNRADQVAERALPYFAMIKPETVQDYALDDDGKFEWVALHDEFDGKDAWKVWDKTGWRLQEPKRNGKVFDEGEHGIAECPVLIFTESGSFPYFGEFAQIADLSKAWFNRTSERDEQLRGQTFNVFTYQLGEDETHESVSGNISIGVNNALLYRGERPGFIAPEASCLENYEKSIDALEEAIKEIGYHIELTAQAEAAAALNLRMRNLSSALSMFAQRLSDFEKRCWWVASRWLTVNDVPEVEWPSSYDIADIGGELAILQQMQASGFAQDTLIEQQKRIIQLQFHNIEQDVLAGLLASADNARQEV